MSVSDFSELTRRKPERSLLEGRINKSGGRNVNGHVTSWHRGGGHKRLYRKIDFKRDKLGHPGARRRDRVRPEPLRQHRAPALRRRREALHHRAGRARGSGDRVQSGDDAEIRTGNALALAKIPLGTVAARDRVQARQGRAARARGGHGRAADGARGPLCDAADAERRAPPRPRALHGDDRAGRQHRSREPDRSARPAARAGRASARTCAASR